MTTITVSSEAGKTCPYCRFPLKAGGAAERCDACGAVHHEECWRDGSGCAVLGCANAGRLAAQTQVIPPAQTTAVGPTTGVPQAVPVPPGSGANRNLVIGLVGGLLIAAVAVGAFVLARSTSTSPPADTSAVSVTTTQT